MKKSVKVFAAGALVGATAAGGYFFWQEYKCLDLAIFGHPDVTQAEAQRVFAGCMEPVLRFKGREKWEREMRERQMKRGSN